MAENPSTSEGYSLAFYESLGAAGLEARTRPEYDQAIVEALVELLSGRVSVLDVGCGYGRVAIALARSGFRVQGIDLSPSLVATARQRAEADNVELGLSVGSMCEMPYPSCEFDAVICLWSAFNELLTVDEQVAAIGEMYRVASPGGLVLVEGPLPADATGVSWDVVEGRDNPHYYHDEASLRHVCAKAGIPHDGVEVYESLWAGRSRQFLRLAKPPR